MDNQQENKIIAEKIDQITIAYIGAGRDLIDFLVKIQATMTECDEILRDKLPERVWTAFLHEKKIDVQSKTEININQKDFLRKLKESVEEYRSAVLKRYEASLLETLPKENTPSKRELLARLKRFSQGEGYEIFLSAQTCDPDTEKLSINYYIGEHLAKIFKKAKIKAFWWENDADKDQLGQEFSTMLAMALVCSKSLVALAFEARSRVLSDYYKQNGELNYFRYEVATYAPFCKINGKEARKKFCEGVELDEKIYEDDYKFFLFRKRASMGPTSCPELQGLNLSIGDYDSITLKKLDLQESEKHIISSIVAEEKIKDETVRNAVEYVLGTLFNVNTLSVKNKLEAYYASLTKGKKTKVFVHVNVGTSIAVCIMSMLLVFLWDAIKYMGYWKWLPCILSGVSVIASAIMEKAIHKVNEQEHASNRLLFTLIGSCICMLSLIGSFLIIVIETMVYFY